MNEHVSPPEWREEEEPRTHDVPAYLQPGDNDVTFEVTEGRKDDNGKPTFHLLPDDALAEIQKVLDFGAQKYSARNWEHGIHWLRVWNACFRHLWAWVRREPCDPETGLSHLAHAGCCILFLIAFELRGVGEDNRPPDVPEVGKGWPES